ncbi:MAG: TlpA family protein disulfide reductase [Ignavibacteriae bacterium]|nr:TlpA family protein disulfide reductase [Ignavibacteria bacterium]MBI3363922.1 TlpA family protein disulfide reductase [Ignavibacteriota bacterium]
MTFLPVHTLAIVVLLLLAIGCGQKDDSKTEEQLRQTQVQSTDTSGNVAEVFGVIKRPNTVPNFSWKDNGGKTVDFDNFHGKVTLVNFWATWCGPCKRELPDLIALSQELAALNIKILGVATDRAPNAVDLVRTFVKEHGIPYQNIVSNDDLEDAFGNPRAIPTSFLVNANGKITQTIIGIRSKEFYRQAMTALAQ